MNTLKFDKDCFKTDPVHQVGESWYFWDETGNYHYGPFKTEGVARERLQEYCHYLDGCGYN